MPDYSEAISKGVSNWLDANQDKVLEVVRKAIAIDVALAVDGIAGGAMKAVGKFLDDNAADLKTGIALAIASSWEARHMLVPPIREGVKANGTPTEASK